MLRPQPPRASFGGSPQDESSTTSSTLAFFSLPMLLAIGLFVATLSMASPKSR